MVLGGFDDGLTAGMDMDVLNGHPLMPLPAIPGQGHDRASARDELGEGMLSCVQ